MTGSGTLLDPYIIYDVNDLQAMEDHLDAYYELANDIDALATVGWNGGLGFDPVGKDWVPPPFTGHFDGKNYTISGLFINRPATLYIGLFGWVGGSAEVKNVKLENADITGESYVGILAGVTEDDTTIANCHSSGSVTGTDTVVTYVGGLVGADWTNASFSNCSSTASVTGSGNRAGGLIGDCTCHAGEHITITGCYATGDVAGDDYIGGLIGISGGGGEITVTRCYATGDVSGIAYLGGLVSLISDEGTFTRCYATGNLVGGVAPGGFNDIGGFASMNSGIITNCYSRGSITGDRSLGGFIFSNDGTITNCYSTGAVSGNPSIGGFAAINTGTITNSFWDTETSGQATSDGGTGKTTAQMKTASTFTDAGWDFDTIWNILPAINNGYPYLLGVPILTPTVTTDLATAVGTTSSTPNGTLDDDGGEACNCGFEWGETIAYEHGATPTESKVTGESFSQVLTGLDPSTTYYFRAFATNSAGTSYGADRTFTTGALPPAVIIPTVTTNPASAIGHISATLNGFPNDDGGEACECGFEWGLTPAYGHTTLTESKVTGESFSRAIHGLFPGFTYHFRAFATNSAGTGYGADRSFTSTPAFSRAHALSREEL